MTSPNSLSSSVSPSLSLGLIRPWVSHYLPHALGGPNHLLPILGKDAILAKHLPKEANSWKLEIGNFPPPPNHTLCKSLDHGPTSLTLAGYRLVVLWHSVVAPLLYVFCFLSLPCCFCHCYSTLSHFASCPFYPCLSFMKEEYRLLELIILLYLHGLVGLPTTISC